MQPPPSKLPPTSRDTPYETDARRATESLPPICLSERGKPTRAGRRQRSRPHPPPPTAVPTHWRRLPSALPPAPAPEAPAPPPVASARHRRSLGSPGELERWRCWRRCGPRNLQLYLRRRARFADSNFFLQQAWRSRSASPRLLLKDLSSEWGPFRHGRPFLSPSGASSKGLGLDSVEHLLRRGQRPSSRQSL